MYTSFAAGELSPTRRWLARSRAWISLTIITPFLLIALFSKPWAPEGSWADAGFDVVCWLLFVSGAFVRWWATMYIGGNKTNRLICDGPYSICRNPIYVGTFLMTASVIVQLMNLTLGVVYLVATTWYLATTISVEENNLLRIYGEEFVEYQRRVPRLLPKFSLYHSPRMLEVKLDGLVAEAKRMLRWGALPILGIIIVQLRAQPWWPDWFHLP